MESLRHDSNMFCRGQLTNMISDGSETNLNILEDFTLCTLQLVKEETVRTWLKHDHVNGDAFTLTQKASFDPLDTQNLKIS